MASVLTELSPVSLMLLVLISCGVGLLIGSVGVGGILLVPALTYIAGIDIHTAIASCLFSYAFNGLAGAWMYAQKGSIRAASGAWLCAGAVPGAWLGATTVNHITSDRVALIIALFVIFAAANAIRTEWLNTKSQPASNKTSPLTRFNMPQWLLLMGGITGFGSALSGSGGPLILVPMLVWLQWPVLTAVGLGQLIQIPISLSADIANFQANTIDLPLGLAIAVIVTTGVMLGARVAHRLPAAILRKAVIAALLLTALWMILQAGNVA